MISTFSKFFLIFLIGNFIILNNFSYGQASPQENNERILSYTKERKFTAALEEIKIFIESRMGGIIPPIEIEFEVRPSDSLNPATYSNNRITLFTDIFQNTCQRGIIRADEMMGAILVVLAHEMTHAWQDHHTNILKDKKYEPLYEGHAVFMQTKFAEEYNFSEINEKGIHFFKDGNYSTEGNKRDEFSFTRLKGAEFMNYFYQKEGYQKLREILENPDPNLDESDILNPSQYQHGKNIIIEEI